VVLLALCHFRKSYRDFCEIVEVCTLLLAELGWRRGASLDYAAQVLEEDEHEEARAPPPRVPGGGEGQSALSAVDSTGFSSTSASAYYTRVLESRGGRLGGHRRGVLTRRYLKQTIAIETRK
jgi:hypothetical protein